MWLGVAGLSGAMSVAMDAMARHHFDSVADTHARELIQIATKHQSLHALALVAVALLAERAGTVWAGRAVAVSGWAFVAGILLFSGSLYGLAFGCPLAGPALVPFGGGAFIVGWLALLAAAIAWQR